MTAPSDAGDSRDALADLLAELRAEVERRRQAGEYPPGLELELDAHFRQQVPERFDTVALAERLRALDAAADVGRHRITTDSGLPMGSAVHRASARLVRRQVDGVLAQLADLAHAVQALLHVMAQRLPDEDVRHLGARVDLLLDRIAEYERAPFDADAATRSLAVRVAALEAALRRLIVPPWFLDSHGESGGVDGDAVRALVDRMQVRGDVVALALQVAGSVDVVEARAEESLDAVVVDGVALVSPRRLAEVAAASLAKLRSGGRLLILGSDAASASADAWLPGVPAGAVRDIVLRAGFGAVDVVRDTADASVYTVAATK